MRYDTKITGNPDTDMYPYSVIDTQTGQIVNSYSHMQTADNAAYRMSTGDTPRTIYDYDETQEMLDAQQ